MDRIANMMKMLEDGRDDLLLRFGLGQALFKAGQYEEAIVNLQRAVAHDPNHSAAWKFLGKAYAANEETEKAIRAYREGIRVAEQKGDVQAAKEMRVFLKRIVPA